MTLLFSATVCGQVIWLCRLGEIGGNVLELQRTTRWQTALFLFFMTSMVESLTMGHVFSFLPIYLQELHVQRIAMWVGILSALTFVIGLPLVPLWGVWAQRYGGKTIIIRSAYVEMIVFAVLGFSQALAGVVIALALVGFQLGNTGIMLASLRRLVPGERVGFVIAVFSVSSPVGMALGPLLGGLLVSSGVISLHGLFIADGVLSLLTGTMLLLFYKEQRTPAESVLANDGSRAGLQGDAPKRGVWAEAWLLVKVTFQLRIARILFGLYTILMLARQMVSPYLPIAIEQWEPHRAHITLVIGSLMGLTALVGAVITIVAGRLGDRLGFVTILTWAFALCIPLTTLLGIVHGLYGFGSLLTGYSALITISGAMVFALLSTRIPDSHRSTALNLVYLPLYAGGIVGPAVASILSRISLWGPFAGASFVFAIGLFAILALRRSRFTGEGALHGQSAVREQV